MIESGKPKTLEFGVADETAWKVGLSCGGTIRVLSRRWTRRAPRHPQSAQRRTRRAARRRRRHRSATAASSGWSRPPTSASDPLQERAREASAHRARAAWRRRREGKVFLTVHVPPPQLVITGAVHISQALAPIAQLLGYDVTIVDPRTAFATPERFPDVKVIAEWPDVALPPLGIDRYTAFVALHARSEDRRSGAAASRSRATASTSARSARGRRMPAASSG